ncbi:MAG: hypothetical protein QM564_08750 [Bergeyella sp.]
MKKHLLILLILITGFAKSQSNPNEFVTAVTFPANYSVGQYFEFVQVLPIDAGSSGYYEISISYTRGNIAAAATFIASISHVNPDVWREAGMINANDYTYEGKRNFTIDVNGGSGKIRIRAINTHGVTSSSLYVNIKVRSINFNSSYTSLSASGSDTSVTKLQPMTNEWNLFVGNSSQTESAEIGLKVLGNGNVGIGVKNPQNKLDVNGTVHAKEVKIDLNGWADYVFGNDYRLLSLEEVEKHIKAKGHLPSVPSEQEVLEQGIELGENQKLLLQKIEELTLYLIEQNKKIRLLEEENSALKTLTERLERLEQSLKD